MKMYKYLIVSVCFAFPIQAWALDCASEYNANDLIEIFAIQINPPDTKFKFKIFAPSKYREFNLTHMSVERSSVGRNTDIAFEILTKTHNDNIVGNVYGDIAEIENWVVSVIYYLDREQHITDEDFECPIISGYAKMNHHKAFNEMDVAKRNAP